MHKQGSFLYVIGFLTDLSLLTSSYPSLGAIIALAHTLSPSSFNRFGYHLKSLIPWGPGLFFLFTRFRIQLLNIQKVSSSRDCSTALYSFQIFVDPHDRMHIPT